MLDMLQHYIKDFQPRHAFIAPADLLGRSSSSARLSCFCVSCDLCHEPTCQPRLSLFRISYSSQLLRRFDETKTLRYINRAFCLIGAEVTQASVSDQVDAKIREQIKGGVWPLKLKAEDWASGESHWLIDVVAQNSETASQIAAGLKRNIAEKDLKLHPNGLRQLDRTLRENLLKNSSKPSLEV